MNFFPEETDSTLRRIYSVASALLPVVTAAAAYWGLEHAASAASGGLIVLLCGLWTHAAVKGGFSTSPKRMKRRLWWRIGWRFILLAITLYAILRASWLHLEPFIAGLSIFVPAIVVELFIELFAKKAESG
jgi:hypothetical protein